MANAESEEAQGRSAGQGVFSFDNDRISFRNLNRNKILEVMKLKEEVRKIIMAVRCLEKGEMSEKDFLANVRNTNLKLSGLCLDSRGSGGRSISIPIDREQEEEVIAGLATIGIVIESRHYNR